MNRLALLTLVLFMVDFHPRKNTYDHAITYLFVVCPVLRLDKPSGLLILDESYLCNRICADLPCRRSRSFLPSFPLQSMCIGIAVFEHKGEGILH